MLKKCLWNELPNQDLNLGSLGSLSANGPPNGSNGRILYHVMSLLQRATHKGARGWGHHEGREFTHPFIRLFSQHIIKAGSRVQQSSRTCPKSQSCVFKVTELRAESSVSDPTYAFSPAVSFSVWRYRGEDDRMVVSEAKHQHKDFIHSFI